MSSFEEIYDEAMKNDWSAEKLENALKEAKIDLKECMAQKELSFDEMASISGGVANDGACKHERLQRFEDYHMWPGEVEGEMNLAKGWKFYCPDCRMKWFTTDPNWKPV